MSGSNSFKTYQRGNQTLYGERNGNRLESITVAQLVVDQRMNINHEVKLVEPPKICNHPRTGLPPLAEEFAV